MTTFKQHKETGEFLTLADWEEIYGKEARHSKAKGLGCDIEAFVSPIDGKIVSGRAALREHNKKHGVTNIADYSPEYFEKRGKEMTLEARGQTPEAKKERCQLIDKTLKDYGV